MPSQITWSTVYQSSNYFKLAITSLPYYELNQGETMILRALLEFILSYSRAVSNYRAKPSL